MTLSQMAQITHLYDNIANTPIAWNKFIISMKELREQKPMLKLSPKQIWRITQLYYQLIKNVPDPNHVIEQTGDQSSVSYYKK